MFPITCSQLPGLITQLFTAPWGRQSWCLCVTAYKSSLHFFTFFHDLVFPPFLLMRLRRIVSVLCYHLCQCLIVFGFMVSAVALKNPYRYPQIHISREEGYVTPSNKKSKKRAFEAMQVKSNTPENVKGKVTVKNCNSKGSSFGTAVCTGQMVLVNYNSNTFFEILKLCSFLPSNSSLCSTCH